MEIPKPTSPPRPRHHLTRSITEMSPSAPRHHHHRVHIHRKDREPQSALPTLMYKTPYHISGAELNNDGATPNGSRRASLYATQDELAGFGGASWARLSVREGSVQEEKERNELRALELAKSLGEINTVSLESAHRLDDTYYNVLEKLSSLQATIKSLEEIASLTRELKPTFNRDANQVAEDMTSQLDAFDNFSAQKRKMRELQSRIHTGREKVRTLGERVDAARQKVDIWQRLEGEWTTQTRKRLRALWSLALTAGVLILALWWMKHEPAVTDGAGVLQGIDFEAVTGGHNSPITKANGEFVNMTLDLAKEPLHALEELRHRDENPLAEEPRLRVFDDL